MNELERLKGRLHYWRENDDPMVDLDLVLDAALDVICGYTLPSNDIWTDMWGDKTCYADYEALVRLNNAVKPFLAYRQA